MPANPPADRPNIFPAMRYKDAPAAIEWLCRAFGFEKHFVVPNPDGTIAHAELKLGPGFVMLGSTHEQGLRLRTPAELGGVTQSIYITVADPDAHFAQAKAAGAEVVFDIKDTDYGSREYSVRDPEGHFWSFGTYQPDGAAG
jgi:uncharacterized glyoxalase superfamily protein PhnB